MLEYKYIFQRKYTKSILSNSTRELLWFAISKMLIAVFKNKFIVAFIIISGTLSFTVKIIFETTRRKPYSSALCCANRVGSGAL